MAGSPRVTWRYWQSDGEAAAVTRSLDVDYSTMDLDEALRDRQAESRLARTTEVLSCAWVVPATVLAERDQFCRSRRRS